MLVTSTVFVGVALCFEPSLNIVVQLGVAAFVWQMTGNRHTHTLTLTHTHTYGYIYIYIYIYIRMYLVVCRSFCTACERALCRQEKAFPWTAEADGEEDAKRRGFSATRGQKRANNDQIFQCVNVHLSF